MACVPKPNCIENITYRVFSDKKINEYEICRWPIDMLPTLNKNKKIYHNRLGINCCPICYVVVFNNETRKCVYEMFTMPPTGKSLSRCKNFQKMTKKFKL